MNIKLVVDLKGTLVGYDFTDTQVVTIGRELGNSIAPLVDNLSRHHAKIYFKDGAWMLEDLGSTNGTKLNAKPLTAAMRLTAGDLIQFGDIRVSVRMDEAPVAAVPPLSSPLAAPAKPAAAPSAPPPPAVAANAQGQTSTAVKPEAVGASVQLKLGTKPMRPVLRPGLKLPQRPGLPAGLKLPPKPGIKPMVPKPAPKPAAAPDNGVADLPEVEMLPVT